MDGVLGFVTLFAGDYAPLNWALCNGQFLPIASNPSLFAVIGNVYGGDGKTTFALPDLRGRAVVGVGQGISPYVIGQDGGAEYIPSLTTNQMPIHTHTLEMTATPPAGGNANSSSPANAAYGASGNSLYDYTASVQMGGYTVSINTTAAGSPQPLPITSLHPVLPLTYIICTAGSMPSDR